MRVNITKGFKIAIDGIHVIDVETGEQDLHEQAANWAMKNGHGQAVKETKAAAVEETATGEFFAKHTVLGRWWVYDREGKLVNTEAMNKKDAAALAEEKNAKGADAADPPDMEAMSNEELEALATEKGIDLDANETKDDLIAKIKVADAKAEKAAGNG